MKFTELAAKIPWGTVLKIGMGMLIGGSGVAGYVKTTAPGPATVLSCPQPVCPKPVCPQPKFNIQPYQVTK